MTPTGHTPKPSHSELVLLSEAKLITEELHQIGWKWVQTGQREGDWIKFNTEGKSLARAGDETWDADNRDAEIAVARLVSRPQ